MYLNPNYLIPSKSLSNFPVRRIFSIVQILGLPTFCLLFITRYSMIRNKIKSHTLPYSSLLFSNNDISQLFVFQCFV